MSTSVDRAHARRPWGIWLVSIGHTLYALNRILEAAPAFGDPLPYGWSPAAATWAPYLVILFLTMLVAAWAVWAGYRHARAVLLITLAIAASLDIPEAAFGVPYLLEMAARDPELWRSVTFWWELTFGSRLVLWLVIEAWYLFGARTRHFFGKRADRAL